MRRKLLIATLLCFGLTSACSAQWFEPATPYTFESPGEDDNFLWSDGVVTVRSSRGIGRVLICPLSQTSPAIDKIRFEYSDGRGMTRLEGLEARLDGPEGERLQSEPTLSEGALELTLPTRTHQIFVHWVDFYR